MLAPALASRFARIALDNVVREYPGKPEHVLNGPGDVSFPRVLHPAFYGSYDWHSSVHMHWMLVRLLRRFPALREAAEIAALLDRHLSRDAIAGEVAYLARPGTASFERTYGWAWLLKLAEELGRGTTPDFARWRENIEPLAKAFVARYLAYLPRAACPLRGGTHPNSAFGLAFALDYARASGEGDLAALCEAKARTWFGGDRDYPASWEPSGSDFLSPALVEADLMRRVLAADAFATWLARFLPWFLSGEPATLFTPAVPTDRGDPQIVHLDGLSFSRAWCLDGIAEALPKGDGRIAVATEAAAVHRLAGMDGLQSGDYMGAHWLASFAVLSLDGA
jgi:hypothetical protein